MKKYSIFLFILPVLIVCLSLLPFGARIHEKEITADGDEIFVTNSYACVSLTPLKYGNVGPMGVSLLGLALAIMGGIDAILWRDLIIGRERMQNRIALTSAFAFLVSLLPLRPTGSHYHPWVGVLFSLFFFSLAVLAYTLKDKMYQ